MVTARIWGGLGGGRQREVRDTGTEPEKPDLVFYSMTG